MLYYNFKYELRLLLRSRWIQLISVLLLALFVFAAFNGLQKTEKRKSDISAAHEAVKASDKEMLAVLDSIEQGIDVTISPWTVPTNPIAIGNYHPRVAAMGPDDMGFLAIGQSDVFTHYVMPTVSGDDLALNYVEMTSPVQLLFGSFDLMFVVVYLLPLIIIAFSYNVLSEEKERGSLRLLASQPISIHKWVLQKLVIRLFWMSVIITLVSVLAFGLNPSSLPGIFPFLGLVFCYMLFWFCLAFAVNISIGESAKNALSLLGLWIVFVLLLPSVIGQMGDTLFRIPPRTQMIHEMRELKAEATKRQDEILDNFLRDHPEYAVNDSTQARTYWHGYMASQKLIKEELEPVLAGYDHKLGQQQSWISKLQWLSPAIITQRALENMAGTTKQDYDDYRAQVQLFADEWRNYFMPLLYNNETFKGSMYAGLPDFTYTAKKEAYLAPSILGLLLISFGIVGVTMLGYRIRSKRSGMVLMQ